MKLTPAHCRFDDAELAYLRARAAAEERSVPWVVRRLVREAMDKAQRDETYERILARVGAKP